MRLNPSKRGAVVAEDGLLTEMQVLRDRVTGITGSALASRDGLIIKADTDINPDNLAALAAASLGLAQRMAREVGQGLLQDAVTRNSGGYVALYSVGDTAVLILTGDQELEGRPAAQRVPRDGGQARGAAQQRRLRRHGPLTYRRRAAPRRRTWACHQPGSVALDGRKSAQRFLRFIENTIVGLPLAVVTPQAQLRGGGSGGPALVARRPPPPVPPGCPMPRAGPPRPPGLPHHRRPARRTKPPAVPALGIDPVCVVATVSMAYAAGPVRPGDQRAHQPEPRPAAPAAALPPRRAPARIEPTAATPARTITQRSHRNQDGGAGRAVPPSTRR